MSHVGYIVDAALLRAIPPGVLWHAESIPGSGKMLLAIDWHGWENHGAAFEIRPDVLHLGASHEVLSAEAATLLAGMKAVAGSIVSAPGTSTTVISTLRKLDSAVARLLR
jgi:hypothetical protein